MSYCADKVKFTDRWTDRRRQRQYPFGLKGQGKKMGSKAPDTCSQTMQGKGTCQGPCLNIKTVFSCVEISIMPIRLLWDCLIFIMGITILVRQCLYIEKPPGGRLNKKDCLTGYGDSHVKDKTSYRPSYLKHGNPHTWKDGLSYWDGALQLVVNSPANPLHGESSINPLASGRLRWDFKNLIFNLVLLIGIFRSSNDYAPQINGMRPYWC